MSYFSVSVDVDIDIDDILWSASNRDKQTLADMLYEDGFKAVKDQDVDYGDPETEFDKACLKLFGQGWRLSLEDEQHIINLAKRF